MGSNLGDRKENLRVARERIATELGPVQRVSSLYETPPWGITDQPDFLNQALEVRTTLEPEAVLQIILTIEQDMGRQRLRKWGERLIDIDILLYDDLVLTSEQLTIPHPFLHQRDFVLAPLAEIAPTAIHPVFQELIYNIFFNFENKIHKKISSE
ncbi:MAG TPA: 2-amino-4-hydroxy-6-hydroxymethyldihydropteridine diphosphokinase [Saprospiraceae bacterium]|nr:2-amino-4-hydroxy-6-hydroxymethyldihydropteridine diphosphokinase [Saprospiraceae bacterium]HMP25242.1 2-amino-4-hydroxy-6-hydroxymethyldihydropteridine diphosphokinase [Saprospiraceae bacterium]